MIAALCPQLTQPEFATIAERVRAIGAASPQQASSKIPPVNSAMSPQLKQGTHFGQAANHASNSAKLGHAIKEFFLFRPYAALF